MAVSGTAVLLLADGRFPAGGHAHSAGVEAAVADGRVGDEATLQAFVRGRLTSTGVSEAALAAATVLRCGPSLACHVGSLPDLDGLEDLDDLDDLDGLDVPDLGGRAAPESPGSLVESVALDGLVVRGALHALTELDAEAEARVPAPPLRAASRRLGRQLLRAAGRCWPHPIFDLAAEAAAHGLHQPVALGVAGVAGGLSAEEVAALAVHHSITTPAQAAVRLLGLDPYAVAAIAASLSIDAERVVAEALAAAAGPLALLPARTGPLVDIAAIEHDGRDGRLFAT